MLELAAASKGFAVSRLEIDRPGPSYAVDTLRELGACDSVVWCIGDDALDALGTWHRAEQLPALCNLLVFQRPGSAPSGAPHGFEVVDTATDLAVRRSGGVHFLTAPMLDISATAVRRAIAEGEGVDALLPPQVCDYIRRNGLYGAGSCLGRK